MRLAVIIVLACLATGVGVSARAQVFGGGPGGPPPGGGGGPSGSSGDTTLNPDGNRWKFGTQSALSIGSGLAGDAILYAGGATSSDYILWNIGALAGPVGGAGALALFESDQGLVFKLLRPNGLRCQTSDVGLVSGCRTWIRSHRQRLGALHKHSNVRHP